MKTALERCISELEDELQDNWRQHITLVARIEELERQRHCALALIERDNRNDKLGSLESSETASDTTVHEVGEDVGVPHPG